MVQEETEERVGSLTVENFTITIDRICCPWPLYLLVQACGLLT